MHNYFHLWSILQSPRTFEIYFVLILPLNSQISAKKPTTIGHLHHNNGSDEHIACKTLQQEQLPSD